MLHVLKLKVLDPLSMVQPAELRSSPADWGARLTQAERRNLSVKDCRKGGRIHLCLIQLIIPKNTRIARNLFVYIVFSG